MHRWRPILGSIIIFKSSMGRISCMGGEVNIQANYCLNFILELYTIAFYFIVFAPSSVMENSALHQILVSEVINAMQGRPFKNTLFLKNTKYVKICCSSQIPFYGIS